MPTMLITGANRGLGLNLLKLYDQDGWTIHACCRNPDSAVDLKSVADTSEGRITLHTLDVEKPSTIADLKAALGATPIDMLINMAGYLGEKALVDPDGLQPFGVTDYEIMEKAYRINCMGPLRVCETLIDNVEASDKKIIINVSSIVGSIGGDNFGNFYMYRPSKTALNAVTHAMAINLKDRGITVIPFHPGFTKTDMGGPTADIEVEESVTGIKAVLDNVTIADTGRYLTWEGGELPW
ncbi:MAG: SDR family oxidoreductase [Rhodospirillaceae bacterium]|jgi:NAD(P)-dependent dehydrogenase (short-subunit alcohol dehydrogenase family)|nr:SDR family oxidoreductase [Rhodospirillaceae bacterium]MBT5566992.1 SDR family oxidoreductase [Rhodospirillaceae bacterium]MBT6088261.1 SDR family oxidoreductase [Rhodospirillaceae bacterium]MBT7450103.1 SDR family oxidoreductase [Rhodospirillaceae bacterium]